MLQIGFCLYRAEENAERLVRVSQSLLQSYPTTPPPLKQTDAFAKMRQFFKHSSLDFGNGYLDNDYGQTLFLDGILMDIIQLLEHFKISPSAPSPLADSE